MRDLREADVKLIIEALGIAADDWSGQAADPLLSDGEREDLAARSEWAHKLAQKLIEGDYPREG